LNAAAAVASLILANAEILMVQQGLLVEVEERAAEAQREAREKEAALREIAEGHDLIEEQRLAIRELSTPILRVWDGVLVLPILGLIDTRRAADLMDRLLEAVARQGAQFAILDITGVAVVDTRTADYLIKVVRAAELIGAQCLLCGVRPAVAQTLVELGIDLTHIRIGMDLQAGLKECLRRMRQS
jgi:rsbT co-antagonist protein RsbR